MSWLSIAAYCFEWLSGFFARLVMAVSPVSHTRFVGMMKPKKNVSWRMVCRYPDAKKLFCWYWIGVLIHATGVAGIRILTTYPLRLGAIGCVRIFPLQKLSGSRGAPPSWCRSSATCYRFFRTLSRLLTRNSLKRHFRLGSRLQTALSGLRMPGRELDNILDVTRERDRTAQQGIFQQFSISSCRKASMQLVAARKLELQRSCGFEYSERSGG